MRRAPQFMELMKSMLSIILFLLNNITTLRAPVTPRKPFCS